MCGLCKLQVLAKEENRWRKSNQENKMSTTVFKNPFSQRKHRMYAQYQRTNCICKLKINEASELELDDEQNFGMCSIIEAIQSEELERLFKEGGEHEIGN